MKCFGLIVCLATSPSSLHKWYLVLSVEEEQNFPKILFSMNGSFSNVKISSIGIYLIQKVYVTNLFSVKRLSICSYLWFLIFL